MNALSNHFPIRQKGDEWEVVFLDDDEVEYYILCKTNEDATAVANARPFNVAFESSQRCNLDEVRKSIDALDRYGLSSTKIYRRLKNLAEDIEKGII